MYKYWYIYHDVYITKNAMRIDFMDRIRNVKLDEKARE